MTETGRLILLAGAVTLVASFVLSCILFGRVAYQMAKNCKKLEKLLEDRVRSEGRR